MAIFRTLPSASEQAVRWGWVASIVDASLRGVGQVVFQNSPITGIFGLAGYFTTSVQMAVYAILGVVTATVFASTLRFDSGLLRAGIWGYNGCLVGAALALFAGPAESAVDTAILVASVVIVSSLSVMITSAIASLSVPNGITPLTFPFQLSTWWYLAAAQQWNHVTMYDSLPTHLMQPNGTETVHQSYEPLRVVDAVFAGIAETFLASKWHSGVLHLIGIFLCSPIAAFWALVGSALGTLLSVLVGVPPAAIYLGLHGYNPCLCGMAIGGFFLVHHGKTVIFLALSAIIASVITTSGTTALFAPVGLPALTWPFTVVTWIVIKVASSIPNVTSVQIASLTVPEDHRERVLLSRAVGSKVTLLQRYFPSLGFAHLPKLEETLLPVVLCAAAAEGNVNEINALKVMGADLSARDQNGRTALHLACAEGQEAVMDLLLKADLNVQDAWGGTPLEDLVRSVKLDSPNRLRLINRMVTMGAKLNPKSTTLRLGSKMCTLVSVGDVSGLRTLLVAGAPAASADYDGRTAAHVASAGSRPSLDLMVLQLLVYYGGESVSAAVDCHGNSPLDDAERHHFLPAVELLNGMAKVKPTFAELDSSLPSTASLESPAKEKREEEIRISVIPPRLLPADRRLTNPRSELARLRQMIKEQQAVADMSTDQVFHDEALSHHERQPLLRSLDAHAKGATIELAELAQTRPGQTWKSESLRQDSSSGGQSRPPSYRGTGFSSASPVDTASKVEILLPSLLCSAAACGSRDELLASIRNKPSHAGLADYDLRSLLHEAVEHEHADIVDMLLAFGADSSPVDRWGTTPLWAAILHARFDIAEKLLKYGARHMRSEVEVATYLCELAVTPDPDLLSKLLCAVSAGNCNPSAADYDLRTPLHVAAQARNVDAVRILLEHGADAAARDRWGNVPDLSGWTSSPYGWSGPPSPAPPAAKLPADHRRPTRRAETGPPLRASETKVSVLSGSSIVQQLAGLEHCQDRREPRLAGDEREVAAAAGRLAAH
jgi:urea transporter